jgi:hypothetical protein
MILRNALLACLLLLLTACSGRPDGVLSPRKMKSFITELHLMEGSMAQNGVDMYDERIPVYYYNALLNKHKITKAEFDSSLVYYTNHPKRFDRIYAAVMNNLEKLEKDVIAGVYELLLPDSVRLKPEIIDLPALADTYRFTPDSARSQLAFTVTNVELMPQDIYHLRFRIRREPRDSSEGAYAALRVHYADGRVDSLWHPIHTDSVLRRYHFKAQVVRNMPVDSLSGVLLGAKTIKGEFYAYLDSIVLQREFIPYLQDSIRNQLDTVPSLLRDTLQVNIELPADSILPTTKQDVDSNKLLISPESIDRLQPAPHDKQPVDNRRIERMRMREDRQ